MCSGGPAISILKALQMFSGIAGVENFSAGEKNKSDIYDAGKGLVTSGDGEKNDYF